MLTKKLFRTAWKYKAQFISMIIMVALGIGVFTGFNMEWYSLKVDTESFFDETNYADYRIFNESGFSADDLSAILKIDGVDAADRVLSVNVDIKDSSNSLALFVPENYTVSTLFITSGAEYDSNASGFWISDKYAQANGLSIGDDLTFTYLGKIVSGKILGLAKSGEFAVCVADENQLMPDFDKFGFAYATPKMLRNALGFEFYPQINICSDLSKAQLEDAIQDALGTTTLVVPKSEHTSYAGVQSEVEEGQTMGNILPVLFLAIAILTMVTTMHRITSNEKVQIGTLKALGFKDRKILLHYTAYGFVIGLLGIVLGVALGFGIAAIIISPSGMMGTYLDMPQWNLCVPEFVWIILICTAIVLTVISLLSVKKVLRGTAAEALRPYSPKKIKPMKIENTRLWRKLPFSFKWNFRDLIRNKARSAMTLIGVVGCMILLVAGLGMKDTMSEFLSVLDGDANNYATRININESAENSNTEKLAAVYDGDWVASSAIKLYDKTVSLFIYNLDNGKINFTDENNKPITLNNDGVYVCIRLSDDIAPGDVIEFSPYGGDEIYSVKVSGVFRSLVSEGIVMTSEYAEKIGIPYHIGAVFTDADISEIADNEIISGTQSKAAIIESYDTFTEMLNLMIVILIIAAVLLSAVVLYNLGVMSYIERSRELSTLKVVGFRDRHIGRILISQNIWLTLLGIIIGFPAGILALQMLLDALVSEYELCMTFSTLTYSVSILLTFGVSLIVGMFVARKNKKIDMVEALKNVD